jgi:hypothetical protein
VNALKHVEHRGHARPELRILLPATTSRFAISGVNASLTHSQGNIAGQHVRVGTDGICTSEEVMQALYAGKRADQQLSISRMYGSEKARREMSKSRSIGGRFCRGPKR